MSRAPRSTRAPPLRRMIRLPRGRRSPRPCGDRPPRGSVRARRGPVKRRSRQTDKAKPWTRIAIVEMAGEAERRLEPGDGLDEPRGERELGPDLSDHLPVVKAPSHVEAVASTRSGRTSHSARRRARRRCSSPGCRLGAAQSSRTKRSSAEALRRSQSCGFVRRVSFATANSGLKPQRVCDHQLLLQQAHEPASVPRRSATLLSSGPKFLWPAVPSSIDARSSQMGAGNSWTISATNSAHPASLAV